MTAELWQAMKEYFAAVHTLYSSRARLEVNLDEYRKAVLLADQKVQALIARLADDGK